MGKGKTTALIKILQNDKKYYVGTKRFIVCVNRITEINRIRESVHCKTPIDGKKISDIKELIKQGENICCTHALFNMFDDELIKLVCNSEYEYDLFYDEQPNVFTGIIGGNINRVVVEISEIDNIGEYDIASLIRQQILIRKDDLWVWNNEHEYNKTGKGIHFKLRNFLKTHIVYGYGENSFESNAPKNLVAFLNPKIFNCFENVWVLSYLLPDSLFEYYLRIQNINDCEYYHVVNNEFVSGYKFEYPEGLDRLHIDYDKTKYEINFSLSKSGYAKMNEEKFNELASKFYNFMRNVKPNVKTKDYIYTVFSEYEKILNKCNKNISLKKYIACNIKGVNDYSDATIVGYLIDRYMNPILFNFLKQRGIEVDEEEFALSEMIQLIWRSNLRVLDSVKKVFAYIPNKRMHDILVKWINSVEINHCDSSGVA